MKVQDKTKQKINEKSNLREKKKTSKRDWSQRERVNSESIPIIPKAKKWRKEWL